MQDNNECSITIKTLKKYNLNFFAHSWHFWIIWGFKIHWTVNALKWFEEGVFKGLWMTWRYYYAGSNVSWPRGGTLLGALLGRQAVSWMLNDVELQPEWVIKMPSFSFHQCNAFTNIFSFFFLLSKLDTNFQLVISYTEIEYLVLIELKIRYWK